MKILSLVDKFKGTLDSLTIGTIIKERLQVKGHEVDFLCMSDGGDGYLSAIGYNGKYNTIITNCTDILGKKIQVSYLLDNKDCYIESAMIVGKSVDETKNIYNASSKGLGMVIKDAYDKGARNFYIGLGGTLSNDGGRGMLEELGFSFFDNQVKYTGYLPLEQLNFIAISDVNNHLLGKNGATYVYSLQKGATEEDLPILEKRMEQFSNIITKYLNKDYSNIDGAGAAGGIGFAIISLLKGKIIRGIDFIIDHYMIDDIIDKYDYIITGEGKIDNQSLNGKVVFELAKRYKNKKFIVICAISEINIEKIDNIERIYSIVPDIASINDSYNSPKESLIKLIDTIKI